MLMTEWTRMALAVRRMLRQIRKERRSLAVWMGTAWVICVIIWLLGD
jgi:hypothetical protein